ncbi:MAG: GNAT family N-acetyltransferase [Candidatus Nanopelagicales bacterium]
MGDAAETSSIGVPAPGSPEHPEYPGHWEADVVLRDGRPCRVRPITPADAAALREFHSHLSSETIYFRFFAPYPELTDRDVNRFVNVDYRDRVALVATTRDEIIGVGRYDKVNARDAEVAFVVRDDHQGRGIGAMLLEHLAAAAWEQGLRRFVAEVLPNNRRMLVTFREAGYAVAQRMEDGVFHLTFDIEPTDRILTVRSAREHRFEARSVERLLNPVGVAVIGASTQPARFGHELLRHLRDYGLRGPLYAVHPTADSILGIAAYPHVADLPGPVDLAVIAIPAESVQGVLAECADAGVGGVVVISSGFADVSGEEGRARQRELVRTARESGMRVVGPNCLGIINTDPRVALNASLSPLVPSRGRVGLFCQSGALGVTILETVARRSLGLTSFVSAGNRADVSANDLLQYWESDPATKLILLYLESIGNPRKFTRITRRLSRDKPVVAVRSGRYTQTLPLGHNIRRTLLPPKAVDAVFEQSGVVQTSSLGELFDVGAILAYQPLPRGDRVAVVSSSPALAILAMDALGQARLIESGDVDLPQSADATEIGAALARAALDPECDSVLFAHIPSMGADQSDVHNAITEVSRNSAKPVIAVMPAADATGLIPAGLGLLTVPGPDGQPEHGSVPTFSNVEDAVRALALVRGYARWAAAEEETIPHYPDIDSERARELLHQWVAEVGEDATQVLGADHEYTDVADPIAPTFELTARQTEELLGCYGIKVWRSVVIDSEESAVAAAAAVGYPVVLKTTAPWLAHRADLGGVRLNLESERALRAAYLSLVAQLDEVAAARLVVQRMAPPGVATVIGAVDDALFGPVVRFGLGGVASELLGDEEHRIPPLSLEEARRLVEAPKASPLLHGYRGADPVDTEALCEIVARVGLMADDLPALATLDLNPVVVSARNCAVLGATARVRMTWERLDIGVRRLLDA